MSIKFLRPYILFLIPCAAAVIFLTSSALKKLPSYKKNLFLTLRSLVCLLLILALCGTSFVWTGENTSTLFLIDGSDSTKEVRTSYENFIKQALELKGKKDLAGVLSFGENAEVERFISKNTLFERMEANPIKGTTNIENAINTALSIFPSGTKKRIVILTDGEENQGKSTKTLPTLVESGIEFKIFKPEKPKKADAAVESLSIPQKLTLGEEFLIQVSINSTTATTARLVLYNGRDAVGEQKVQLQKGINKYVFTDKAATGGFKTYKVLLEAQGDGESSNNEASAFTTVLDKPRILVMEENKGDASEVVKILKSLNKDYTFVNSKSAPRTLEELSSYKSVILCNVSVDGLNKDFLNILEPYVRDVGGGFITIGGDNSYALGGYLKTPIEKVLPLYMDMRGKKEIPTMALNLIIDHSGSMADGKGGITKVELAKEAAIRSLDSLREKKDEIGVLTFDDSYSWVVKRQVVNNTEAIKRDIGTIREGGGTSILPALTEGYKSLMESSAKIKHIILLTDGQAEKTGYEDLIRKAKENNITISTVAVGSDADKELLKQLAKDCNGRFYETDEYSNIPKIFAKETFMAAQFYLNNREFTPIIMGSHPIINDAFSQGAPALLGYVGTSAKERGKVLLQSDEEDPILAIGQYGLGKTAAWTSDMNGKWSANYVSWSKNLQLWKNLIDYTVENYNTEDAELSVTQEGESGRITYTDKKFTTELPTKAVVIAPNMESSEIVLYPSAPGKYSAAFDMRLPGVYMIKARQEKDGQIINALTTGLAKQYSQEYKINADSKIFEELVKSSSGKYITKPEEVFTDTIPKVKGEIDLTDAMLILALILFMLDVALRRLNFTWYGVVSVFSKFTMPTLSKFKAFFKKEKHKASDMSKLNKAVEELRVQEKSSKVNSFKVNKKDVDTAIGPEAAKPGQEANKEPTQSKLLDTSALLNRKKK